MRNARWVGKIAAAVLVFLLPAGMAGAESLFWRVDSDQGTVFVLGSIHLGRGDFYPLPRNIEQAFDQAEVLCVEADITSPEAMSRQVQVFNSGLLPAGDRIENHLSARTLEKVKEMGLDLTIMSRFKPWLAALQIQVAAYVRMGLDEAQGVDVYFLGKARNEKSIKEIEGLEFQESLFNDMSEEEQDLFLYYTLLSLPEMADKMNRMIEAWKIGDSGTMAQLLFEDVEIHPEVAPIVEKMFYDRNRGMAEKIGEYLVTGRLHFVIVGAGHLVGPGSVIERLKERGYRIDQL